MKPPSQRHTEGQGLALTYCGASRSNSNIWVQATRKFHASAFMVIRDVAINTCSRSVRWCSLESSRGQALVKSLCSENNKLRVISFSSPSFVVFTQTILTQRRRYRVSLSLVHITANVYHRHPNLSLQQRRVSCDHVAIPPLPIKRFLYNPLWLSLIFMPETGFPCTKAPLQGQ